MSLFDWLFSKFEFLTRGKRTRELEQWLGVPVETLRKADLSYQRFEIKKNSGKKRIINAPNDHLKSIQRIILRRLLRGLKVHDSAMGFEPGKSIVDAAKRHIGKRVVLNFDIVDFFPSTKTIKIRQYFRAIGWNYVSAKLLTQLVTHEGGLPQGAPTSPRLSNLVNFHMDARLRGFADAMGADYTRYADDITISLSDERFLDINEVATKVLGVIVSCGYQPHIGRKLKIRRRNKRQTVNGLVVNEKVNLPRERRRWLRAVKHRARSHWKWSESAADDSADFKASVSKLPTVNQAEFMGWLAFEQMVQDARQYQKKLSRNCLVTARIPSKIGISKLFKSPYLGAGHANVFASRFAFLVFAILCGSRQRCF